MAKRLTIFLVSVLLALLGLGIATSSGTVHAQSKPPEVVIIRATGPIVQPFADYVYRGINEANQRHAEALILVLNTPGGSVNTSFDMIERMRASEVPIIVYVAPSGAKAASAGLLITLAGHASAMAPETAIGASSPVGPGGVDLPDTAQKKAQEYISAEVRSLAERRGSAATKIAEEAVTNARAVTVTEAHDAHLVDFVAADIGDLLKQLDGFEVDAAGSTRTLHTANATVTELPMTLFEQTLLAITDVVSDPNIAFLLLAGGIVLIIVEFSAPGGWVAGALGVVSLGLALYGIGILPVNWLGMVFIVLAFVLFLLDVKAPTHGLLTLAAIGSLIAGAIVLFGSPELAPFGALSIPLVILVSIAAGGAFFVVVMTAVRAQRRIPITGKEGIVGKIGRVTQDLAPSGVVQVWGENWLADAHDGKTIASGSEVEVVAIDGLRLKVRGR
jgi:membrane-bound serine protease (ClpP class)